MKTEVPVGIAGCRTGLGRTCGHCMSRNVGEIYLVGESGTVVPLLPGATSAPWRPSHAGAGMLHMGGGNIGPTFVEACLRAVCRSGERYVGRGKLLCTLLWRLEHMRQGERDWRKGKAAGHGGRGWSRAKN